jgi:hypothetical protein
MGNAKPMPICGEEVLGKIGFNDRPERRPFIGDK